MKKDSFEYNTNEIDIIIEKLDKGELSLDESIKEYEKAMRLLKKSADILNKAEGKVIKVTSEKDEVNLEVDENV